MDWLRAYIQRECVRDRQTRHSSPPPTRHHHHTVCPAQTSARTNVYSRKGAHGPRALRFLLLSCRSASSRARGCAGVRIGHVREAAFANTAASLPSPSTSSVVITAFPRHTAPFPGWGYSRVTRHDSRQPHRHTPARGQQSPFDITRKVAAVLIFMNIGHSIAQSTYAHHAFTAQCAIVLFGQRGLTK